MESQSKPSTVHSNKPYQQVLKEIELIGKRSAILKSIRDTENLEDDER